MTNSAAAERFVELSKDLHPPLSAHEARVESDRCYFCFDAPCVTACPTGIDIPLFIRQISAGNAKGAGKTIFDENILGGMCARVCPTETLCEEACVRNLAQDKPVEIGLLQRHATDLQMQTGQQPYVRASSTGKSIAVVGAGPAGLGCAHRLALHGHSVTIFEQKPKTGGLNEYGIAAYKTVDNFAQREIDYVLSIGGVSVKTDHSLGKNLDLIDLRESFDAVFLGIGLGAVNALGVDGEDATGVVDAVDFISTVRQANDFSELDIGDRVLVIGGGMTAIDAAVQTKILGSSEVTLVYRRSFEQMNASRYEQELAKIRGVVLKSWLAPTAINTDSSGHVCSVEFEQTVQDGDKLVKTGLTQSIQADRVLIAIGQTFATGSSTDTIEGAGLEMDSGRVSVDANCRTTDSKIWAGGDCISGGDDLTVAAVQDGKVAAESIHAVLTLKR